MITIHKWLLAPRPGQSEVCMIPAGGVILSAREQDNGIAVWALVDTDAAPEPRSFVVAETGQEIKGMGRFVGTAMFGGGVYVLHVFEARPK